MAVSGARRRACHGNARDHVRSPGGISRGRAERQPHSSAPASRLRAGIRRTAEHKAASTAAAGMGARIGSIRRRPERAFALPKGLA
jgi:hypothetical protein